MLVRQELGLDWFGVAHFYVKVLDVVLHQEACFAILLDRSVVPFDVDAGIFCAFLIHDNLVVFFKCHLEVTSVAISDIFHSKIINNQHKGDGEPLVLP